MSDRLKELQHQRALVQEQLAWLDREIAEESGGPNAAKVGASLTAASAAAQTATIATAPATNTLVDFSHETPGSMAKDAKRGCLIAFTVGMLILFVVTAGAYALYLRMR